MATKVVGLDIGTHAVRAAELTLGRHGETRLESFGQVALPLGAVVAGEVADPAAVTFAIKRLWREVGFSSKRVIVGVGNQRVVVRPAELPDLSNKELRSAIEFRADELIPIPLDDAVLDFQEVERTIDDEGTPVVRVLVAVAQRDMIRTLLSCVEAAGLQVAMVDLSAFALLRSMGDPTPISALDDSNDEVTGTAEALVSVGAGLTTIVVHEAGVPRFVRTLVQGGAQLTEALHERFDLDLDSAEALKRQIVAGTAPPELADEAAPVFTDQTSPLIDDIRGSIDYFLAQNPGASLGRVVISGGGSRVPRMADQLRALLGVPAIHANPLTRVSVGDTGLDDDQLTEIQDLLAVPLGLALAGRPAAGGVRRLSLLPTEVNERRNARRQGLLLGAAAALLVVGLGYLWVQRTGQIDRAEEVAVAEEARVQALTAELNELRSLRTLQSDLDERRGIARTVLNQDVAWAKLIQEMAAVMPDDTWLSSFRAAGPTNESSGTFTVSASGFDHTSAARWILRIEGIEAVDSVSLPTSSRGVDDLGIGLGETTFDSQARLSTAAVSDRIRDYLDEEPEAGGAEQ